MHGLMQSNPINLVSILEHASRWHSEQEVVSNTVEGGIHRQSYAATYSRVTRLASSLARWGVEHGDRMGTLGWNTHRHLEAWYAISGQGAICHTVNPRLFSEQIVYIVNHAEDRLLFIDLSFVDLVAELMERLPTVESIVIMTDRAHMPNSSRFDCPVHCYEDLIEAGDSVFEWPDLDENTGSSLCYTSGTTGEPKGVLYSHRGNLLHAYATCGADVFDIRSTDTVLMVVPMFHANSWGLAYSAPMVGAKMVLPGPHMDGASIYFLITEERVTKAAAVPTVWNMLIAHLRESDLPLRTLQEVIIGGAAVPRSMIQEFDRKYAVEVIHAWGMTEMTPLGTINRAKPFTRSLAGDDLLDAQCKQGRVPFGVDMKIVDDDGKAQPHDGKTYGRLLVKGPWTVERYYKSDQKILDDGWFDTGDIASIDQHGYMQITDRSKDVIKSGGEWISSVDIENAAMGIPGVEIAACIGAAHPKWDERPLLLVKAGEQQRPSKKEIRQVLAESFASWQVPDDIVYVDDIPLTATGKIHKKPLRSEFRDFFLD